MPTNIVFRIFGIALLISLECDGCLRDYLPCGDGFCVYVANWCDRKKDCRNGNDEKHCNLNTCPENWLSCGNGQCYRKEFRCNIFADCINGFDERNCNEGSVLHQTTEETKHIPKTQVSLLETTPSTEFPITAETTSKAIEKTNAPTTTETPNPGTIIVTTTTSVKTTTNTGQQMTTNIRDTTKYKDTDFEFSIQLSTNVQSISPNTVITSMKFYPATVSPGTDKPLEIMVYYVFPVIAVSVILIIASVVFVAVSYIRKTVRNLTHIKEEDMNLNSNVKLLRTNKLPVNSHNLSSESPVSQNFTVRVYDEINDSDLSSLESKSYMSMHSGSLRSGKSSENSVNNLPEAPPLPSLSESPREMPHSTATAADNNRQISVLVDCAGYVLATNVDNSQTGNEQLQNFER